MILCAKGLKFLIEDYEIPMMFLFVALIVTQIPDIKRMGDDGKQLTVANIVGFIIGVAIMLFFMVFGWSSDAIDTNDPGIVVMFLVGIIYAMSMLSPGISGSTVLLALGLFAAYDAALADINMKMLLPMAVGLLIGGLAFAKVIDHFMKNSRKTTYAVILGLTVGSALTVLINASRDLSGSEMIIQSIICIFIGAVLGLGLNKLAHIFAKSSAEEEQSSQ